MQELKHWANSLEVGDRVIAFIRHQTDGSKKFRARFTVVENDRKNKTIVAAIGEKTYTVPYNELRQLVAKIID